MGRCLVSNPPYNLKWSPPPFAQIQPRFSGYALPPNANANYAFVLTSLDWIDDRAALLLPNGIQSTSQKQEAEIRRQLVIDNLIEAVIALPDGMFESTSIPTCVLLLNKHKCTQKTVMVDMRKEYAEEQRDQRGQYGGASHEGRVYHKTVKVLTDAGMEKALRAIREQQDIPGFSRAVLLEQLQAQDYILTPGRYIEAEPIKARHRSYEDIAADYNRIIRAKILERGENYLSLSHLENRLIHKCVQFILILIPVFRCIKTNKHSSRWHNGSCYKGEYGKKVYSPPPSLRAATHCFRPFPLGHRHREADSPDRATHPAQARPYAATAHGEETTERI